MGAGDFTAGTSDLAGEDPVAELSAPRNAQAPIALAFDAATRTFLRDDDGRYYSVHPVDQKVALAIFVELGKITAAPNEGGTLRSIKYLDPAKIEADARDRIQRALARVLSPGDIAEVGLKVAQPTRWSVRIVYEYRNLREPGSRPRVLEMTSGG
jgi:hypothetical protein